MVYTDFCPTPLQHYAFPVGGSGLYLVVDEKGEFKEESFAKLKATLEKKEVGGNEIDSPGTRVGRGGRGGRGRGGGSAGREF